jgi:hypothetical protein
MKVIKRTSYALDTPYGEVEVNWEPVDWIEPLVTKREDGVLVVTYAAQSYDNETPECDFFGNIYHHPQSRNLRGSDEYYEALGLDQYGDHKIDDDAWQAAWEAAWKKIAADTPNDDVQDIGYVPTAPDVGDDFEWWMKYAGREFGCLLSEEEAPAFEAAWAKHWGEQAEGIRKTCLVRPDPNAVPLDLYEHSGRWWSIAGHGVQDRWDTTRYASVWVLKPEHQALLDGWTQSFRYARPTAVGAYWFAGGGRFTDVDEAFNHAIELAEAREAAGEAPELDEKEARRLALGHMCAQDLRIYNEWAAGSIYDIYTEVGGVQDDLASMWPVYGVERTEKEMRWVHANALKRVA